MSSRLAYQSPEFTAAAADPQNLQQWEKSQFSLYQATSKGKNPSITDLLACGELAIRVKDAACAENCFDRVLQKSPKEADAHYLKAILALAQNQTVAALQQLETATSLLQESGVDSARVWRLLAQELLRQKSDLRGAVSAFAKACELAAAPPFIHTTTRSHDAVNAEMLDFDFAVFDRLYAWEGEPSSLRLVAVATGPQDKLFLLDSYNRWIFQLDAEGRFERGVGERQLAQGQFLHPETRWDLSDICVGQNGNIYIAGNKDSIGVFSSNWKFIRSYVAPASHRALRPQSIAIDSAGQLYVLYLHTAGIHVFNPEGFHEGSFGNNTTMPETGKNYYCGLATDQSGQVYLYDREKIQVFSSKSRELIETISLPSSAGMGMDDDQYPYCWNGISVGPDSQVYVADTAQNQILGLSKGKVHSTYQKLDPKLQNFSQPFDITVDSQGRLYVADTQHARVLKYEKQTWSVVFGDPTFYAV
jgi:streptogramin lyase